jgi:N-acetylmuramoyl-L-alanine amidase CwlA
MYDKNPADKKKFKQKKLKIGIKLQKNLDKNKFGLDKKKSYCLSIKKYCLSIKKMWSGEEKTKLYPTPPSTHTISFHIHNTT